MKKVALVLTAGGAKVIYDRFGRQLSFIYHWPLFNKKMKELSIQGEVFISYEDRLKNETISRLERALELFKSGAVEIVFNAGGFQPSRKNQGLRDSVEMMNDWLIEHGVSKDAVVGKAFSVDTGGNIDEFVGQIKRLKITSELTVYLVTSWYHLFRSKIELQRALKKEGISAHIVCVPVFPKFDAETLKFEYAYNLLTEIPKLLSLLFPCIKSAYRKREYEARK